MKAAKGELEVHGQKLKVKAALTQTNKERNWALRKAEELLKGAASQKAVKLEWAERLVKVDGVPAFVQDKVELRGCFQPPFANLSLPQ